MIPFFTFKRQNEILKEELEQAVREVINRGIFILGPKVSEFEEKFAEYLGIKYAVGVASGTDALSLSLLAAGVGAGDEVILPANAYPTVFAVTAVGAVPKLVDIDPATFNIDPAKILAAITPKTKAIIGVHLYGQPADLISIRNILICGSCRSLQIPPHRESTSHTPGVSLAHSKKQRIYIIEDCAQAHGARLAGDKEPGTKNQEQRTKNQEQKVLSSKSIVQSSPMVGTIGDVGCFSFYPTKNLGCFGDGGMVVTNNPEIYEKVKLLRMYGEKGRYNSVLLGRNSRLDELQAAILLVKLRYLDKWNSQRREIADLYFNLFKLPISLHAQRNRRKKGRPSEGFLISLSSGDRGEPSPMTSTGFPHLHHSQREIIKNASRANIIQLPFEASYAKHVYHLYVIRTKRRDKLKDYLEKKGIQTAIHYPKPIHLQPSFQFLGYRKGDFPETERASREILSLPIYPELTNQEIKQVVQVIKEF